MEDTLSQLVVTTSLKAKDEVIQRAKVKAQRWGLPFVARESRSIEVVLGDQATALLFTNNEMQLVNAYGQLAFNLSTAFIRLKAFERGERDPLVRAGELDLGDRVLDTTFGLGRDSRVAARAAGTTGSVIGLESSKALFHLGAEGLENRSLEHQFTNLSAPIELVHADALEYLRLCDPNSFDVVLIDPMFDEPTTSDRGFDMLRFVADPTPLSREWVEVAKTVARRWVLVKTSRSAPWFADVGLLWVKANGNARWYRAPGSR